MYLNQFLLLAAILFCLGVYGVLARKNAVLVLMSIELMLNAVNINLIAFGAFSDNVIGQVFALFLFGALGAVLLDAFGDDKVGEFSIRRTAEVSDSLFGTYVVPFEVVSILLLAALVGAVALARRD